MTDSIDDIVSRYIQRDEAYKATARLTSDGSEPTIDLQDAPSTARAVIESPDPIGQKKTWEQMSLAEKTVNSLEAGYNNLLQSRAVADAETYLAAAQSGVESLADEEELAGLDDESREAVLQTLRADTSASRDYRDRMREKGIESVYEFIDLQREANREYVAPQSLQRAVKATEGKGFWDATKAFADEFFTDPSNMLYVAGTSFGTMAPYLTLGAAGGGIGGVAGLSTAARAVQGALAFMGSYSAEYGSAIASLLKDSGVDVTDKDALVSALSDESSMQDIRVKAANRASVVGALDGASIAAASIKIAPGEVLRTMRSAGAGVRATVAQGRAARMADEFGNIGAQSLLQGSLGGAGEALGSLAMGAEVNWGEVLLEAVGEFTGAPAEVFTAAATVNIEHGNRMLQAEQAKRLEGQLKNITAAVSAISGQVADKGSVQAWAQRVGEGKSVFAFAQDLVESGAAERIREQNPELADRIEQAAQEGGDIAIPVGDVLGLAAIDEGLAQDIVQDVRTQPDGMSPRQAEDFMQNGRKEAEAAFEKIISDSKPDVELARQATEQANQIRDRLVSIGVPQDVASMQALPWKAYLIRRAKQLGKMPQEIMHAINLRVQREQVNPAAGGNGLEQPISQGIEWHMGPAQMSTDDRVSIVQYKGQTPDRKTAIDQIVNAAQNGIKNEETGFVLTAGKGDLGKSAGGLFSYNERVLRAVAPVFPEIIAKAKRLESFADVKHKNRDVQGIHVFASPVNIDGNLFRVNILVRDYVIPGQERLAAHTIAGVKIYEIENPPASKISDGGSSDILTDTAPTIRLPATETQQDHAISLADLAGGRVPYVRADGRGLFDPVDASSRDVGGAYYEPSLGQDAVNWAKFEPEVTSTGKIKGAPEWVTNRRKLLQMRKLLMQLAKEGESGRFWYEDSAESVMRMVRGNIKLADKYIQLLAIYSPKTVVWTNSLQAVRAFTHWASGKPASTFHVGTASMDKKAVDVLYNDKPWEGRKTNSFYSNLMYDIVTKFPKEARAAGIDVDDVLSGRATIDLWMLRAFGYANEQASDDVGTGKYSFSENEVRRLTALLNKDLPEGADPWTPHQVQAAIWTAMKTRYEMPEVKAKTNANSERQGLITRVGNKYDYDNANSEQRRKHLANWRKAALEPGSKTVTELARQASRDFNTEHTRQTQIVTWEANPSSAFGHAINNASPEVLRAFTDEALSVIVDENGHDEIADALGVPLVYTLPGDGGYSGAVSPNTLSMLVPARAPGQQGFSRDQVRTYARAIQYIFKQDAVPFFRFENKPLSKSEIADQRFRVVRDGRTLKAFDTQAEAQAYASSKGENAKVVGGKLARSAVFTYDHDLTAEECRGFLDKLISVLGEDAGFTRTSARTITVINFRDDENHLPFAMSDEEFVERLANLYLDEHVSTELTWTEGEYGYWHDWSADPEGRAVLGLLGVNDADNQRNESELREGDASADGRRGHKGGEGNGSREPQEGTGGLQLVRRRLRFEEILEKYTPEYIAELERNFESLRAGQVRQVSLGFEQTADPDTAAELEQIRRGMYTPVNAAGIPTGAGGVLRLMETYDKSTFLHESAHAWLDLDTLLAADIVRRVRSGEAINEQEQQFLNQLGGFFDWGRREGVLPFDSSIGIENAVDRWQSMSVEDQRGMHELFARGFEAYVSDGVSPNSMMAKAFARFRRWLKDIYRDAASKPNPISPEVRKLFDLMFVSEQQAQDAEARLDMRKLFDAQASAMLGMTDEEARAYEELNEAATQETETMISAAVSRVLLSWGKIHRKEVNRIKREQSKRVTKVRRKLLAERRYRAVRLLTEGVMLVLGEPSIVRLQAQSLRRAGVPTESVEELKSRGWATEAGSYMTARTFAETFGTSDVRGLIGEILEIRSLDDAEVEAAAKVARDIKSETGMLPTAYNDLEGNLAAHNATRGRLIMAEYNAMARRQGSRQMMARVAADVARDRIGDMVVSDIHPAAYMNAERRCAQAAEKAFVAGDIKAAMHYKRAQLINFALAKEALEAGAAYEKAVRAAKRLVKSKSIHPRYRMLVAALLDAHSVAAMSQEDRRLFAAGDPDAKALELAKRLQDEGTPVEGLEELLSSKQHVRDMTLSNAQDFFSVLAQVAAFGRNAERQRLVDAKRQAGELIEEGKEKLAVAALEQKRRDHSDDRIPITRWERTKSGLSNFFVAHIKISSWCRIFDRNQDNGFFWNLFVRSANRCTDQENTLRAEAAGYLQDRLLSVFKKNADEDPLVVEGFDRPFTHGMRIVFALNWGNESNRQRLIGGDTRFTPEAVAKILSSLSEADWRAVEAIWQYFESLRPQIAAKEIRVYGVEPEWIEYGPFTVTTAEGKKITVSGGYYPVKYDPYGSNLTDKRVDAEAVQQEMRGAYQSATTKRSFTKSRVKGEVHLPVRLDFAGVFDGINDVIHDLCWHEWLIDTKRVLDGVNGEDSGLRAEIREHYGYKVAKSFEDWRTDIAQGGRMPPTLLGMFSRNVGIATMGWSLRTAATQLTGLGYSIPRVGTQPMLWAITRYLSNPVRARRDILQKSEMMRNRGNTQTREISQIKNRLERKPNFIVEHAYFFIQVAQNVVDTIVWMAAYDKAQRQGTSEADSVAIADSTVKETQSSGDVADMSAIEREPGAARFFTVFYGWANSALNVGLVEAMGEKNRVKAIGKILFLAAVMPTIETLWREALTPGGDDDEDAELWRKALGATVGQGLNFFVGLREVANAAQSLIEEGWTFGYSGPAGTRIFSSAVSMGQTMANDPVGWGALSSGIDMAGMIMGVPATQINRTLKGMRAIESGDAEDMDAVLAPIFGYQGRLSE